MVMRMWPQNLDAQQRRELSDELDAERRERKKQRENRAAEVERAVTERAVPALAGLWRMIERDAERLGPSATDVAELRQLTRALAAEAATLGVSTRLAEYDAVLAQFDAGATRIVFAPGYDRRLVAFRTSLAVELVAIEAAHLARVDGERLAMAGAETRPKSGGGRSEAPAPALQPKTCKVELVAKGTVQVTEGDTIATVKGDRACSLLLAVAGAARALTWSELVRNDMANAGAQMDRRSTAKATTRRAAEAAMATPRMVTTVESMTRAGCRVRTTLGKLGYHWKQDGERVWWEADCQ